MKNEEQNFSGDNTKSESDMSMESVAIIGMAGRFPGAMNVREFWKNLCNGVESIVELSDEELRSAGVSGDAITDPLYLRRFGLCKDTDMFDAEFFGIHAREAEVIDPQHRVLLECAWEAFEDAGYSPEQAPELTGVYVGSGLNRYLMHYIVGNRNIEKTAGDYQIMIGNGPDYLATRISYKLNLRGPSVSLYTACSTSLVAVHTACLNLLNFQCDMALAGGISLKFPQKEGMFFKEGHIISPDGRCRAFDENANGTVWSEGAGVILVKRLSEAIQDGDSIYAIIRGTAINNDGSGKIGYTAPSVEGQSKVIESAHAFAGVQPDSISYVEAHGTGTHIGDPIEITGLKRVFSKNGRIASRTCAIGSVKTNIGHLDAAAGIAGLIKTALALKYKTLPPSLHFTKANPQLSLEQSPFYVNTTLSRWNTTALPRRAGVSSFGIGGTNAHAVLEEAPDLPSGPKIKQLHVVLLSAKTPAALENSSVNLSSFLKEIDPPAIADVAYTLQVGRKQFPYRRAVVCAGVDELCERIDTFDMRYNAIGNISDIPQNVVFMFSGQGSQYPGMTHKLYNNFPLFRENVDYCSEKLKPLLNRDLRELLFAKSGFTDTASQLSQTQFTQPALFTVEYCLATLLMSWNVQPTAMIGHSIGEYVAGCISGVFTLDDALYIIASRARLMQEQPPGTMLSISAPEEKVQELLCENTEIALVNAPQLTVVGGPEKDINRLAELIDENKINYRRLHTSHAFHTSMMDQVCKPLEELITAISTKEPQIPYISNVTGTWITPQQVKDPAYWSSHMRAKVLFSDGIDELIKKSSDTLFIEVGPGNSLCTLAAMHSSTTAPIRTIQTVPHIRQEISDDELFLHALGTVWTKGINVDWKEFYKNKNLHRINLPTYPFERQRYWAISGEYNIPKVKADLTNEIESCKSRQTFHPRPQLRNQYVAPSSIEEKSIVEIWERFLGVSPIGIHDNFFDIGGHSLIAVEMFEAIQSKTSVNLPMATLFSFPTVHGLTEKIRSESQQHDKSTKNIHIPNYTIADNLWSYIVPIKPAGKSTPFFCVHGVGGNVLHYHQISAYLDEEQPIYGIQCRGLDGIQKPFNTIMEMASAYIDEIKKVQPQGPYIVGGGSMGGLVAFEIAQQLLKMGEQVEKIIMFDSYYPKGCEKSSGSPVTQINQPIVPTLKRRTIIKRISHSINCRLRDMKKLLHCWQFNLMHQPIPHELRYWLVEQKNLSISQRYTAKKYTGSVIYFRAMNSPLFPDPYRGWRRVISGGMIFYDFPCSHENTIEHIDLLKKLGEVLKSDK